MDNRFGICEWSIPVTGPFAVSLASEIGFDGIQLGDLGGGAQNFPLNHPRVQQGYLEQAETSGITLQSLHLHTLVREGTMRYPLDSVRGAQAKNSIQKGIEACAAMKIDRLMLSSFFASEIRHDYDFINFAKMLQYACDLGGEYGVHIVYEGILHIDRMLRLLDMVGNRLTVLYDTLNPIRFGSGDPAEEIRRIGIDRIDHIHVKDAPHEMEGCCLLGTGEGRFQKTVSLLDLMGYAGWYITENYYAKPPMGKDADPYALARVDLETMKRVLGRRKEE